jgi:hypothetical protein
VHTSPGSVFVSTSVNGKIGTATPQYVSSQLGAGAGRTSESLLFLASCKKGPMNAETPGNKGPMISAGHLFYAVEPVGDEGAVEVVLLDR